MKFGIFQEKKHLSCRVNIPCAGVHHLLSDLAASVRNPLEYEDFVGVSPTTLVLTHVIHYYNTGFVLKLVLLQVEILKQSKIKVTEMKVSLPIIASVKTNI